MPDNFYYLPHRKTYTRFMFRYILSIAVIIIGWLGQYFFGHYEGDLIPYQTLWEIISYVFIGLGSLLMISAVKRKTNDEVNDHWKEINELKDNSDKIIVNFADCTIRNNDYIENVERHNSGLAATDILAYKLFDNDNVQQVAVNQSVVIYEHSFNGKKMKYNSIVISKDKVSLLFHLDAQKSTTLYVDKYNRSKYYFDMEFLYK